MMAPPARSTELQPIPLLGKTSPRPSIVETHPSLNYRDYAACLFDFDGVIIDSEPLHAEAKRLTLGQFRIPHAESLFAEFKGRPDSVFFEHVAVELASRRATAEEMQVFKQNAYSRRFGDVPLVDGVLDFLAMARKAFPKLGLATSATRRDFELGAARYQLVAWFDAIVTGDDTVRHKPDPEPYLKAMSALGVKHGSALVIEDSPSGIRAAKAAHCPVIGLMTTFGAEELRRAGADCVVASYAELARTLGLVNEPGRLAGDAPS
jgi:beta-phosphoglucomutase